MEEPKDFTLETKGCGLRFNAVYTGNGLYNIIDEDSDTILILNCDKLKDGIDSCDIKKIEVIKEANIVWDELYKTQETLSNDKWGHDDWTTGDYISWGETMSFINKKGKLVMYYIPLFDGKHDEEFDEFYEFVIDCPTKHNMHITDCYKKIPSAELIKCHDVAESKRREAIQDFKNLQEEPDNGYSIYF